MKINEISIISGKGGTGKTSLVASLVPFFDNLVIADCDVDAPDLNILFGNTIKEKKEFSGLKRPVIDYNVCNKCGLCHEKCKFNAITKEIVVNNPKCEGCGVCEFVCPVNAISMKDFIVGNVFVSKTKYGDIAHARLIPGEETSGKLVSEVRNKAKQIAKNKKANTIIIDGSPGIACNVISSITGASKVVIVTEPTLSGLHDLKKVHNLVKQFKIPVYVVINKYDLSKQQVKQIEAYCDKQNIEIALKIPFNRKMVEAISKKQIPSLYINDFFKEIGFDKFVQNLKQ